MKYPLLLLTLVLFLGCGPYEETKYHVYYHGDGATEGSPPKDSKDYSSGQTATILGNGNLKNGDYTFIGWREWNSSKFYSAGNKITINYDDVNLYAVWDDGINTPFSYKIENGEVTVTRYNEQQRNASITIPDTLQSKPVTAIDDDVFSNSFISNVILPKNLKRIGIGAFASNSITLLIIPDTVKDIGLNAFRKNDLRKITLGTGLSAIQPYTFGNNKLKDITIPPNIVTIGTGAFNENEIEQIKIGAGVDIQNDTSLGTYGESFRAYYNIEKKSGTYIYAGDDLWERY
jgi:hypothetical protein